MKEITLKVNRTDLFLNCVNLSSSRCFILMIAARRHAIPSYQACSSGSRNANVVNYSNPTFSSFSVHKILDLFTIHTEGAGKFVHDVQAYCRRVTHVPPCRLQRKEDVRAKRDSSSKN